MIRVLFYILKTISFIIRPLRHGYYMRLLQKAYEIQGVNFRGKASYIHHDVYIDTIGRIDLGENIVISTKAILLAHAYSPIIKLKLSNGDGKADYVNSIHIGDNVFIGAGAIILPSSNIGNYCIIGAGAVVKGTIPDYSVVVGNPCKIIKSIKPE